MLERAQSLMELHAFFTYILIFIIDPEIKGHIQRMLKQNDCNRNSVLFFRVLIKFGSKICYFGFLKHPFFPDFTTGG